MKAVEFQVVLKGTSQGVERTALIHVRTRDVGVQTMNDHYDAYIATRLKNEMGWDEHPEHKFVDWPHGRSLQASTRRWTLWDSMMPAQKQKFMEKTRHGMTYEGERLIEQMNLCNITRDLRVGDYVTLCNLMDWKVGMEKAVEIKRADGERWAYGTAYFPLYFEVGEEMFGNNFEYRIVEDSKNIK